jgi:hypothetical protein
MPGSKRKKVATPTSSSGSSSSSNGTNSSDENLPIIDITKTLQPSARNISQAEKHELRRTRSIEAREEIVDRYLGRCSRYQVHPDGAMLIALKSQATVLKIVNRISEASLLAIIETLCSDCPTQFTTLDLSRCKQITSNGVCVGGGWVVYVIVFRYLLLECTA